MSHHADMSEGVLDSVMERQVASGDVDEVLDDAERAGGEAAGYGADGVDADRIADTEVCKRLDIRLVVYSAWGDGMVRLVTREDDDIPLGEHIHNAIARLHARRIESFEQPVDSRSCDYRLHLAIPPLVTTPATRSGGIMSNAGYKAWTSPVLVSIPWHIFTSSDARNSTLKSSRSW